MNLALERRLARWKQEGKISPEQHLTLTGLAAERPFSVFLELNALLYIGVLSFIGGLGWTIQTYFSRLGDAAVLLGLNGLLIGCLYFCFRRGRPYARGEVASPALVFDYVLYLGCLAWSVELTYLEMRFHLLGAQWDGYLFLSAFFFFVMAYRFDNRFVLSLALSALAAWCGLKTSSFGWFNGAAYRGPALIFAALTAGLGGLLRAKKIKNHFFGTYLHFAANAFFIAAVSGAVRNHGYGLWLLALLGGAAVAAVYGVKRRQFIFVAYAVVYAYIGLSARVINILDGETAALFYLAVSAFAVVMALTLLARRMGSDA